MSVTIEGIKGYEYQYKVTLLVALISDADKINLFVEVEGSEDALLVVENNGVKQSIEIQVKRENKHIDIPKIINWLVHFQERKSDNNLLQKLIASNQNTALFITHSRCSDSTVKFKTSFQNIISHRSISISSKWFDDFKKVLKNQKLGKTSLMKERELFCKQQANSFKTKEDLSTILENCLILEEFTDKKVDNNITSILNTNYNIAQSQVSTVYLKLLEIVKNGRDTGCDIYSNLMNCVQSNKIGTPIFDNQYKTRLEESSLIKKINEKGVLLLTGTSQCGKTELAKTLSNYFVKQGYDYQIYDNIPELKRFLHSNISDNKIVILDDPFGHILLKDAYFDILRNLKEILSNREKHHYIIVSSRIDVICDLFETTSIENCKIKNIDWCNLTIKNNTIINSFWIEIAKEKLIPKEISTTVSEGILGTKSTNLLQIGQLIYLANEDVRRLNNKRFSDLEHIARRNSKEIAKNLKKYNKLAADILSYVSICSNTIHKLLLPDLAYILSDAKDLISVMHKGGITSGGKTSSFPEYPSELSLSQTALAALNYLEERGFINMDEESLIITHPNYYEAGRYLFFERGSLKQKAKLQVYKKCLGCLNTSTAYQASKNYAFIHDNIRTDYKDNILKIAFLGLNSIFPSVEDNSIVFLVNFILEIEADIYNELINKIQEGGTSSSYIFWNGNIPYISKDAGFPNFFDEKDLAIVQKVEKQLLDKLLPNIHDTWIYLNSRVAKKDISFEGLLLLLQFNEAFIREKVTYAIFERPKNLIIESIQEVFNDEHPSVIFSAIRAALLNWFLLSKEIKEVILELTRKSLNKQQVAIRAYSLISTFSIDYTSESVFKRNFNRAQKNELWQIWGELYPICVESIPLGVNIDPNRFGLTMDTALEFLDLEAGIKVLNSWYKRIDYQINNNKILDEFEMAIADNLLKLSKKNYEIRKELFPNLVHYHDTSFLLSNLKWIVEHWSDLHSSEKNIIIKVIKSNREDLRWIKAVLLNSYSSPPKEITLSILGVEKLDSQKIDEIYEIFPEQLLRDCLNVYSGFPQPLWWLAVHHHNREFWGKLIRFILKDESNLGFDICLQEFLGYGVNGFSSDEWNDWEEIWSKLCKNAINKHVLAISLMYNTARSTCNLSHTKKLWSLLIESYHLISKGNDIIDFVASNFEIFQQTGHKEDLFEIFENIFLMEIIKKLKLDYFIFNLLKMSKHDQEENLEELINVSQSHDVRFFGIFTYINKAREKDEISEQLITTIESLPNLIDEKGKKELGKLKNIKEYKLDNWIGIN